jgi:cobalt-zinc-cadmium efflux system protein
MPHDHSGHSHIDPNAGDARIGWAIVANMALTAAQIVGGVLSGSLALIADALHNFSDAIALILAFFARKIARRPADERMSFGYGRVEVVAALVNYTTLIVLSVYLIYEGIMRFANPEPINGWMVVWIATIALVIDVVTALLTYSMAKESMNIRAAFIHNLADALGSVAVIVAGTLVILYGWLWVDPVVTLLIAFYILWHVKSEFSSVVRVLMLGAPDGMDAQEVIAAIRAVPGVSDLHHLHLWQMQEHDAALQAHIVIDAGSWGQADEIKTQIKEQLADQFGIHHSTLELECAVHTCDDAPMIGH